MINTSTHYILHGT